MNQVQSVTLLKDATAKAIYGSKAANGVVVVETIRPEKRENEDYLYRKPGYRSSGFIQL